MARIGQLAAPDQRSPAMTDHKLVFHYAPRSRASTLRILLDELGANYELKVHNAKAGDLQSPEYLKINPLGKVPALQDGETLITESIAIALHVADLYPEAGLTPGLTDPRRGAYLRWMVFYAASFEPAVVNKSFDTDIPRQIAPYCTYDAVMKTLAAQLEKAPHILGDQISAADIFWGSALRWTLMFDLVPDWPVFTEYAERITARPSFQRVLENEAVLDAEQEAAANPARIDAAS